MSVKKRGGQKEGSKQTNVPKKKEKKKNVSKTSPISNTEHPKTGQPTKRGRKRANVKYPGLSKGVNGKFRQEQIEDLDYLDKLTDAEKEWMNRFMEEFNGANFNHPGKKLHKTVKERRELYTKNNARQRDIFNHKKNTGLLVSEEYVKEKDDTVSNEDILIDLIDKTNDEET